MTSTPKCFAADCQLPSAYILALCEVGTSFWCPEHYPDYLVGSGTTPKAKQVARDAIDRLRGAKIASVEVYD